ncbi:MAG: DUF397 domain-containing protein [Pseudonocardia sp.]|nr:DUF397 domain-containing protein [Pseudonocardia sp.]
MPASDGHRWFTSSHSDDADACVEVAYPPNRSVLVRDTKAAGTGPTLRFRAAEWRVFLTAVRDGEFDAHR